MKSLSEETYFANGWLFHNPDTGIEWSAQHPVQSGEVPDALSVRRPCADELLSLLVEAWEGREELLTKNAELVARYDALLSANTAQARRIGDLEAVLSEARKFVDDHTEDWYVRGNKLLNEIDALLTKPTQGEA